MKGESEDTEEEKEKERNEGKDTRGERDVDRE